MAEVYKAKEYGVEGFERTVAVKRILPHVAEDDEFIAMFKDEAKIAVQLNHGNIAQIYNLGNEEDSFYIALEYVAGRDLRAIFQRCQQQNMLMPVQQACYTIMKICEGLDYAHKKKDKYQRELNIVHRDVSPPNILVSFEGEVKLIDFGVAKAAGRASRTQAGILKGKFGYMSPEQVRGMPLDKRSDVFSVGVVLFEILTETRLFQAETDFATLEKVRAVEIPRPSSLNPDIPKPLENIMYKALAREPEQRYQSSIELHDELQAFMFAQGLFYSRKDLAAWMRTQYAREVELEKEKDKQQASLRPEMFGTEGQALAQPAPRRQRKTMMMPSGGGPPPPPPPSAGRRPPPPPPGRATGRPRAAPTAAHQSISIGPPQPNQKVKRKTMVMSTSRPNLPPPPGASRAKRREDNEAPTVPLADALPRPTALPAPNSKASLSKPPLPGQPAKPGKPKPKATKSYAATAAPPDSEFDWDDDELETRLFGDEDEPPTNAAEPRTPREENDQVGGAIRAVPVAAELAAANAPTRAGVSVTVSPPGGPGAPAAPRPFAAGMGSVPQSGVPAAAKTVIPPSAGHPPAPFPPAPVQHGQHGMAPMGMAAASSPAMAQPAPYGGPAAAQSMPHMPPAMVDYDDRGGSGGNTGAIIGILVAVIVLLLAAFGVYLVLDKDNTDGPTVAKADSSTAGENGTATPPVPGTARGALTIQTTPASVSVTVDGKPFAGESPFIVSDLSPGPHKLTITKDGYMPVAKAVEVGASAVVLQYSLQHKEVALLLETDPKGAAMNLLVDGKATQMGAGGGQYNLTRQEGVKYEVEAVMRGYHNQRKELSFSGEPTQRVSITLLRDNSIAAVTPTANPTAPAVAPTPTNTSPRNNNRRKPRPKTTPRPSPRPKPATPKTAAKTSILRIGTMPGTPSAKIIVDGVSKGNTPKQKVMVTPGRHTITFKWDDGGTVTKYADVADGGSQTVRAAKPGG